HRGELPGASPRQCDGAGARIAGPRADSRRRAFRVGQRAPDVVDGMGEFPAEGEDGRVAAARELTGGGRGRHGRSMPGNLPEWEDACAVACAPWHTGRRNHVRNVIMYIIGHPARGALPALISGLPHYLPRSSSPTLAAGPYGMPAFSAAVRTAISSRRRLVCQIVSAMSPTPMATSIHIFCHATKMMNAMSSAMRTRRARSIFSYMVALFRVVPSRRMCVALPSFSCRRADVTENRRFRPIGTFGD